MNDCIFCKIIAGEIPADKVYEDERVFVFLDHNPMTRGHSLVIPKRHAKDVHDISPEDLAAVAQVAKKIASSYRTSLRAEAFNFIQANGELAGQEVWHYHLHIVPRYADSKFVFTHNEREEAAKDLTAIIKQIQSAPID